MLPSLPMLNRRPGLSAAAGFFIYLLVGLTFTTLGPSRPASLDAASSCPAPLLTSDGPGLTILQGNLWMLPHRPLLVPYDFATDRRARVSRLVEMVRSCRPDVVVLQEVFEQSVVDALAEALPEYRAHDSGLRTAMGTVNLSGLLTLTRVPSRDAGFTAFPPLPSRAKLIERLGRKGFLATEVATGQLRALVVNTHLYAARTVQEEVVAREQLDGLLSFVESHRAAGREILVAGDFNLDRPALAAGLGPAWSLSRHGTTYDPVVNPYTVRGANDTPGNHRDRSAGRGRRAVDFLVLPAGTGLELTSSVITRPLLSDHHFLAHALQPPGTRFGMASPARAPGAGSVMDGAVR